MLKWVKQDSSETLNGMDATNTSKYHVVYFTEYKYWSAITLSPIGMWLPKDLHLTYANRGMIYDLPNCQFKTQEEARAVAERHYKLLILQ